MYVVKTKAKTETHSRQYLGPRFPKQSLETSWDQDPSIENSKPGYNWEMRIGTDRQLCDVVAFDIELIHLGAVTQGLRQTHQLVVPASQTQR